MKGHAKPEMEHAQKSRDLGVLVNEDFKPTLQLQKAVKRIWCELHQLGGLLNPGGQ